jgi:phosphoesterase RecJ-like protein
VDTIVVLDVGLTYRLGRMESPFLESKAKKICIDHHLDVDASFDLSLTEPGATSTGEILYGLLKSLGAPLTPDVSTPLYTSISVDSGNFSYERCTPETFRIASELVDAGAVPYWIHLRLNWQRSMAEVKLDGEVIQRLRTDPTGEIAHSEVTQGMLRQYEIDPMEIPTLVNIPLSIEGVEIALLFVELKHSHIKVSARSKGKVQVCDLAKFFGGGGHPLAAGFSIEACLDEARTKVLGEARRLLGYAKNCLQEV